MSNKRPTPCEYCISLAICKPKVLPDYRKPYDTYTPKEVHHLIGNCSILRNWTHYSINKPDEHTGRMRPHFYINNYRVMRISKFLLGR